MTPIFWSQKKIWHFNNDISNPKKLRAGFTLIEVTAAAVILVIIGTSVLTVINQCIENMVDSESKIRAFKVARENMESLLGEISVSEMIEFGSLEDNPDIEWELAVESFNEPANNDMWIRAVSTASYTGSSGDREYIELTHWLTDLTDAQVKQIEDQRKLEEQFMDETLVNPYGDDPEGLMMFQEGLASDGKLRQAAKVALDLLREYPDSPEAEDAAGDARMYARKSASFGDYGRAADIVIEIASLLPDSDIAKQCVDDAMKYANDAAKSGQYRDAAKIANKIAEDLPGNPKAEAAVDYAFAIAKLAAATGDYRAATDIIDNMGESHPDIKPPPEIAEARDEGGWDEKAIEQPPDEPVADNDNNNNQIDSKLAQAMEDWMAGKITFDELVKIARSQ